MLPKFSGGWTPNRVLDNYGRSIFASTFNFLFFAANGVSKVSFFSFYKLFSASVFALFSTGVLAYFLRSLPVDPRNKVFSFVFSLIIAVCIFKLLPWRNQVHFICYQLPAFSTFVLLGMTAGIKDNGASIEKTSCLLLLSYVCSFSLEAFSAAIFIFNAMLLGLHLHKNGWQVPAVMSQVKIGSRSMIVLTNMLFSLLALLITIFFSERARVGVIGAGPSEGFTFGPASKLAPVELALFLIGASAIALWRGRKMPEDAEHRSSVLFCIQTALVVLAVTFLISLKTRVNYLAITEYPWGDLMLVGKIAVLYLFALVVSRVASEHRTVQPILTLLLVVLFSKLQHGSFQEIEKGNAFSRQVEVVYARAMLGDNATVKTGLQLDAIPMQVRPLPTASSPEWFIKGYETVFKKYYGVKSPMFE
ncbi:hypothetical protein [Rhizobium sp. Root1220]|uniref:hypothetical protein n=1 Tax=Rhizobium sp. Root1220 TaxID=1736432 RepID=UPI0012E378B4|nr:hypothetical protein [Rhizobium sp. Root1220]